jgi:hypothetical protein
MMTRPETLLLLPKSAADSAFAKSGSEDFGIISMPFYPTKKHFFTLPPTLEYCTKTGQAKLQS